MSARAIPADHALRAYQAMAEVYDVFTAHHDYAGWTASLEALARAAGLRGRRLLDVACGTGKSFMPFLERGYEVTACDVSPRMAARARAKAGPRARVEVRDMRRLGVLGTFDLVTCLDDAVNYLLEPEELAAGLRGMAANLAMGGVLVFDANTLRTYREFFGALVVIPGEQRVLVWRGRTPAGLGAGERARAELEVLRREERGTWTSRAHVHVQRHHREPAVRAALAAAGLRTTAVHGMTPDGTIRDGFDELGSTKALYVAVRSPAG